MNPGPQVPVSNIHFPLPTAHVLSPTIHLLSPTPHATLQLEGQTPAPTTQYYSPRIQNRFLPEIVENSSLLEANPHYADIGYAFDEQKSVERTNARLRTGGLRTDLPIGWPERLHGPLVWTGSEFFDESRFVYSLSNSDQAEIMNALDHSKRTYSQSPLRFAQLATR